MQIRILFVGIILSFAFQFSMEAQSIQEEPGVTRVMDSFVQFNREHQTIKGWRVQVLVTTDRRQMERVQREFKTAFPDYELHFKHENPFYHLKTGAFASQNAAWPLLKMIQERYPDAFLVTDEIEMEEVLIYL